MCTACTAEEFCPLSFHKFDSNNVADSSKMSMQMETGYFLQYYSAQKAKRGENNVGNDIFSYVFTFSGTESVFGTSLFLDWGKGALWW